jgi:hypothetical protein
VNLNNDVHGGILAGANYKEVPPVLDVDLVKPSLVIHQGFICFPMRGKVEMDPPLGATRSERQ